MNDVKKVSRERSQIRTSSWRESKSENWQGVVAVAPLDEEGDGDGNIQEVPLGVDLLER